MGSLVSFIRVHFAIGIEGCNEDQDIAACALIGFDLGGSSMNFQIDDFPAFEHEAESERHGAARKVAGELGLEDCLLILMSDFKRCDGVVVFLFCLSAFHSATAANPS